MLAAAGRKLKGSVNKVTWLGGSGGSVACPENCHGRGKCNNGKCVCNIMWTGEDCTTKRCPFDCSGHGKCNNGTCICAPGYLRPACNKSPMPGSCHTCADKCAKTVVVHANSTAESVAQDRKECMSRCLAACMFPGSSPITPGNQTATFVAPPSYSSS